MRKAANGRGQKILQVAFKIAVIRKPGFGGLIESNFDIRIFAASSKGRRSRSRKQGAIGGQVFRGYLDGDEDASQAKGNQNRHQ